MTKDDLARVRDDLETIKSAIGLPPRWDPREVRINLLFAASRPGGNGVGIGSA